MIGACLLACLLTTPTAQAGALEAWEQELYLEMSAGQWKQARQILERGRSKGAASAWLETLEGDLCFWEGSPSQALSHYRRASQRMVSSEDRRRLAAKIADAERELEYREKVGRWSDWAKIGGMATILVLLVLPLLAPRLWRLRPSS